jgi:hypothetical protein
MPLSLPKNSLENSLLERLKENLGALAVELTIDDLRGIVSAAAKIRVQGAARYPKSWSA